LQDEREAGLRALRDRRAAERHGEGVVRQARAPPSPS
jgi:hypothetical protein